MLTVLHVQDFNVGKPDGLHDWPPKKWLPQLFNRFHARFDWLSVCSIIWKKALNSNKPIYCRLIQPRESTSATKQLPLSLVLSVSIPRYSSNMIYNNQCCVYLHNMSICMNVIETLVPQQLLHSGNRTGIHFTQLAIYWIWLFPKCSTSTPDEVVRVF